MTVVKTRHIVHVITTIGPRDSGLMKLDVRPGGGARAGRSVKGFIMTRVPRCCLLSKRAESDL